MVTEELSDEDTLLEDDEDEDEDIAPRAAASRSAAPAARSRASAAPVEEKEPGWVIAAAILSAVVMIYGFMVAYNVNTGSTPAGLTSMWAPK
jgi:hypothetical protein